MALRSSGPSCASWAMRVAMAASGLPSEWGDLPAGVFDGAKDFVAGLNPVSLIGDMFGAVYDFRHLVADDLCVDWLWRDDPIGCAANVGQYFYEEAKGFLGASSLSDSGFH